jgi:hypothetical protein
MARARFIGMGARDWLHARPTDMGDVVIHESVQGHDAPDRAHRHIRPGQQAPDPELPGIRMGLLEVIDLYHERQPDLAGRGLGRPALVDQAGAGLGLKPVNPGIDRRPRDVQNPTDTDLIPAPIIEFDDLQSCLVAIRGGVVVPQPQVLLTGGGTLLPELLDRAVVEGNSERARQDPGSLPGVESVVERLQPVNLTAHGLRNPAGSFPHHDVDMGREESEHPLLSAATAEGADGVGMGRGFVRAWLGRPIGEQHEGANDLVAPLRPVHKTQLQLCKRCGQFHPHPFHRAQAEGLM